MTIVSYETCNNETYALLKKDRTRETYPSTQFYSFPYTEENITILRKNLGANSGGLILEPLEKYSVDDIKTLTIFTFTDTERDVVTAAMAVDKNNQEVSLKVSLDEIFPSILYDIFKDITLSDLTRDNALNHKDERPYNTLLKTYKEPDEYGVGITVNDTEIEKGDILTFSGFKAFSLKQSGPERPDIIEIEVNENGVLFGIMASIKHVNPDGSKLSYMDIEAEKENMTKDAWLKKEIEADKRKFEKKYQNKLSNLKKQMDLTDPEQLKDYNSRVESIKHYNDGRLHRSIESLKELDDDAYISHITKLSLKTLSDSLTLVKHTPKRR